MIAEKKGESLCASHEDSESTFPPQATVGDLSMTGGSSEAYWLQGRLCVTGSLLPRPESRSYVAGRSRSSKSVRADRRPWSIRGTVSLF